MLNDQMLSKLQEMKLSGMAEAYKEQSLNKEYKSMSFEDRFSLLVDLEYSRRKSNNLNRLIKTFFSASSITIWFSKVCLIFYNLKIIILHDKTHILPS